MGGLSLLLPKLLKARRFSTSSSLPMIFLLFALAVAGCTSRNDAAPKWTPSDVNGKHFSLIDERKVENFNFFSGGYVQGTFGAKDGPWAAPEYRWEIDSKGILIIRELDGNLKAKLKKVHEDQGKIVIEYCGHLFCSKREYQVK
jgi:hypothetical protein